MAIDTLTMKGPAYDTESYKEGCDLCWINVSTEQREHTVFRDRFRTTVLHLCEDCVTYWDYYASLTPDEKQAEERSIVLMFEQREKDGLAGI